ncbi:MAG: single-stranded DNA-binding protein [Fusobacteriaceae bacterium]
MNLVVLIGRLTRDPELKFGQSGKAYSKFALAVDNPFKKGEADFINCVAFGKTAELIGEYLRKGKKVAVNGKLQMNRYEINGEKRTSYDVLVEQVEFIEPRGNSEASGSFEEKPSSGGTVASKVAAPAKEENFDDDEFPF